LVDVEAARPAGRLFRRGAELWRPAQDCAAGYGSGLTLCRIDRLEETGFAQTAARRLGPPPGTQARGVHTLEVGGGFELIDVFGRREAETSAKATPGVGSQSVSQRPESRLAAR
jgi:hypothetical protein